MIAKALQICKRRAKCQLRCCVVRLMCLLIDMVCTLFCAGHAGESSAHSNSHAHAHCIVQRVQHASVGVGRGVTGQALLSHE